MAVTGGLEDMVGNDAVSGRAGKSRSAEDRTAGCKWRQANCGGEDAKAARAVAAPWSQRLPS